MISRRQKKIKICVDRKMFLVDGKKLSTTKIVL